MAYKEEIRALSDRISEQAKSVNANNERLWARNKEIQERIKSLEGNLNTAVEEFGKLVVIVKRCDRSGEVAHAKLAKHAERIAFLEAIPSEGKRYQAQEYHCPFCTGSGPNRNNVKHKDGCPAASTSGEQPKPKMLACRDCVGYSVCIHIRNKMLIPCDMYAEYTKKQKEQPTVKYPSQSMIDVYEAAESLRQEQKERCKTCSHAPVCARNVSLRCSHYVEAAPIEAVPEPPKFKAGDRVRNINHGASGTVEKYVEHNRVRLTTPSGGYSVMSEDCLELIHTDRNGTEIEIGDTVKDSIGEVEQVIYKFNDDDGCSLVNTVLPPHGFGTHRCDSVVLWEKANR
jgi:hypothetical protein